MTLPTTTDEILCILNTFETIIEPKLLGIEERSAAATMSHMLRHVAIRVEREGPQLFEEIDRLHPLLNKVQIYLSSQGESDADAAAASERIATQLASAQPPQSDYRDVASLAAEVRTLRQGICEALTFFNARAPDRPSPEASELHNEIRRYLSWQLAQEAQMIEPAFDGFGPRR